MRLRTLTAVLLLAALAATPARAGVAPGASLDGPSAGVLSLGGVALAQDASGGVVYLKLDGGVPHVFFADLQMGAFGTPVRVDGGVTAPASAPQIAAASNGRIAIAWLAGGSVWTVVRPAHAPAAPPAPPPPPAPLGGPQAVAPATSSVALAMGVSGAAYLSWTITNGAASDVRAARLDRSALTFVPLAGPISGSSTANAGAGARRSRVAVAGDGTGVVTWGEDGADGRTHVLSRRVYGTNASTVTLDLTADALAGHGGLSADSPVVGIQYDSSYFWVAFRQTFDQGGGVSVSRVVVREVIGSQPQPPGAADGLNFPAPDGADAPSIAINGLGDGLLASELVSSHQVIAAVTAPTGFTPGQRINMGDAGQAPLPAVALSRNDAGLVAWQPDSGSIQGRLIDQGTPAAAVLLSRPEYGPVDAPDGLAAAADDTGDVIVGFVQGDPANHRIAVATIVAPPGKFVLDSPTRTSRSRRPQITWEPSKDAWSAVTYQVTVDGKPIGSTRDTSFVPPAPIASGLRRLAVIATDSVGQHVSTPTVKVRIGSSHAPKLSLSVSGPKRPGSALSFSVHLGSTGLRSVAIDFGDGQTAGGAHSRHSYSHAGTFKVRVVATDRAGRRATLSKSLKIG